MTWRATVLTLFPEMFPGPLGVSLAGKALTSGLWRLEARDIRDSATDRHRSVDDTPAGGGPGLVLRADVLAAAIDAGGIGADRPGLPLGPRGRAGGGDRGGGPRGGPAAPADEPARSVIAPVARDGTGGRAGTPGGLRQV